MAESSLKQKTAKGLFWGGISSGAEQLIGVAFGICFARILSPDDYGLVEMLAIFIGIASTITNSGFFVALINKQDATHRDYNAVFWFNVFVGLLLYIILFFSAPLIARFFGRPELVSLSRILFSGFFFAGLTTVPMAIMYKQLLVKQQAIVIITSLLLSGSIGFIFALAGRGYWALVAYNISVMFFGFLFRYVYIAWKPSLDIDFKPLGGMLAFSSKLLITGILSCITGNIFSFLLGKFYSAAQLGYFSQGKKWTFMGQQFINGMFNLVSQPILVQIQEEQERQINVLRKMIRFGAFLSFPMMLGLAFVAEEFIVIVLGDKWLPSVPFLQLFCLWGSVAFLWNLFVNLIYTHEKSNIYMYITIAAGLLQLAIVVCMYPFGLFPMVIGYILVHFISLPVWLHFVHRLIGLRLRDVLKDILPYLLITLGCFFIARLITGDIRNLYGALASKIVISAILYILALKISNSTIFKESTGFIKEILRIKLK